MSLSCGCGDYDGADWWWFHPEDFSTFKRQRGARCNSCGTLVRRGDECVEVHCWRRPKGWVEERIHGEDGGIPMGSKFMCSKCGEILLNLLAYEYCITLGDNMEECLREHWEITGYTPEAHREEAHHG